MVTRNLRRDGMNVFCTRHNFHGSFPGRDFGVDSVTCDKYLQRLTTIREIPPPSEAERELAERYAYGVFVLSPLRLQTTTLEYRQDAGATPRNRVATPTREEWLDVLHIRAFAQWTGERTEFDMITWAMAEPGQQL